VGLSRETPSFTETFWSDRIKEAGKGRASIQTVFDPEFEVPVRIGERRRIALCRRNESEAQYD
jgi:hypothetical protein